MFRSFLVAAGLAAFISPAMAEYQSVFAWSEADSARVEILMGGGTKACVQDVVMFLAMNPMALEDTLYEIDEETKTVRFKSKTTESWVYCEPERMVIHNHGEETVYNY